MKIAEKIKKFFSKIFKKEEVLMLQDGNQFQVANERNNFIQQVKQNVPEIEHNSIEHAIDQYAKSLYFNFENGKGVSSYKALTDLEANGYQQSNGNKEKENELIQYINQYDDIGLQIQRDKNGNPSFYHIKSKEGQKEEYKPEEIVRFYINIKRKNIAETSKELIQEFGKDAYYFKFIADDKLDYLNRSESIVIYANINDVNNILSKVEKVQQRRPELFEGAKRGNPFMNKTCNGYVSYAPEVTGNFVNNRGENVKIASSYNTLLSTALEESYILAAREIIARNEELTRMTNGEIFDNIESCVSVYPEISKNHNEEFINEIKKNLRNLMKRNNELDINFGEKEENYRGQS